MSYELEYFTEFLENPSAPELNEFFIMVRRWCNYIIAHKQDFNYLEDEEWREIRERLLEEMDIRFDIKEDLEIEWEDINETLAQIDELDEEEAVEMINRKLNFMKDYQGVFDFADKDIEDFAKITSNYEKSVRKSQKLTKELQESREQFNKCLHALDNELIRIQNIKGKTYSYHWFKGLRRHKGN